MTIPDYLKEQQERNKANEEVESLRRNYSIMISLYTSESCTESEYYNMLLRQEDQAHALKTKYSKMPSIKKKLNDHLNELATAINNIKQSGFTGNV